MFGGPEIRLILSIWTGAFEQRTLSFELFAAGENTLSVELGRRGLLVVIAPDVVLEAGLRLLDAGLLVGLEVAVVVVVVGEPIFRAERPWNIGK